MKKLSRVLGFVMAFVMLVTMVPMFPAYAEDAPHLEFGFVRGTESGFVPDPDMGGESTLSGGKGSGKMGFFYLVTADTKTLLSLESLNVTGRSLWRRRTVPS